MMPSRTPRDCWDNEIDSVQKQLQQKYSVKVVMGVYKHRNNDLNWYFDETKREKCQLKNAHRLSIIFLF